MGRPVPPLPSAAAPVLVVLLDSAECELLERWADDGTLPHLAALRRRARAWRVANRVDLLPESLWPELTTGRSVARTGHHNAMGVLRTGSSTVTAVPWQELDRLDHFWIWADRAGKRAVVLDIAEAGLNSESGAWQVQGFAVHNHFGPPRESPREPLSGIVERIGRASDRKCQDYGPSHAAREELLDDLLDGLRRKTELALELLGAAPWDLFCVSLSQAHCVAHELWHLHDEDDPRHDPAAPARLRTGIRSVYEALDRSLGRILATVGEGTTVLVLATHGMTRLGGAQDMLPELLEGLGLGVGGRGRMRWAARLPMWAKRLGRRLFNQAFLDRHRVGFYTRISGFHGAAVLPLMNYRTGAVRLNLVGREPEGRIQPGGEADEVMRRIVEAASELVDERTGRPILMRATRAHEAFGEGYHADLPDLFLEFRQDLGPIDAARSERLGRLVRPRLTHRTGDHTSHSRLWIAGPRTLPGERGGEPVECDLLDLAPTILHLSGVEPPPVMDGRSLLDQLFR